MQKRKIFTCTVGMLCALVAGGQITLAGPQETGEDGRAERRGQRSQRLERLGQELNLSEAQQAEIRSLVEQQQNQARTLREDTSLTRAEKRERRIEIRQATQERIQGVLTSEQQERFAEMRKQAGERRGGRRDRRNSR